MHGAAVIGDAARGGTHAPPAEPNRIGRRLRRAVHAPKQGSYSRDELSWTERFRQVVVPADGQPDLDVRLRVPCRQHQDGDVAFLLDPSTDLEAVDPGQHQVENDEVGPKVTTELDAGDAVGGRFDLEAF